MFDYAVTVRSLLLLLGLVATFGFAQSPNPARGVKPLFRDPVYDGAADPVVVWNPHVKRWWMFYTNRRANAPGLSGVAWVHGTRIAIAESADLGATWSYAGTADIELPPDIRGAQPTLWAPDVFTAPDGAHHMFLTVVPGVFENWQHPRTIVHLTSADLRSWRRARPLSLASDRVIDAAALQLADGSWRMWYNNERDGKSIYYADSRDLLAWNDRGKAVGDQGGEGPVVFRWRNAYWMITDVWDGLAVYRSTDAASWSRQAGENLLQRPGRGADDQVKGGHPDVVVDDATGRAFLFYFTHPGRSDPRGPADGYDQRRSSIQVVELEERDGRLTCDRDAATSLRLTPPATGPGLARQTPEYLFAYFTGNGEDGLHFARSTDGLKWTEIAGGRSFLKPAVGSSLMRDPSIARGPDGTFHLVWTTGWWDRGIGIAHSRI